tara:strand:+ start:4440 stop:4580 length:141 start_codon:yes stop_codon:yes gene_type:complete
MWEYAMSILMPTALAVSVWKNLQESIALMSAPVTLYLAMAMANAMM